MKKIKLILLLLAIISSANSQTLTIAHNGNSPELITEIANYIHTQLNVPVKVVEYDQTTDMINALKYKKAELAFMGTFGYILVKDTLGAQVEPLLVYGKNGVPGSYTSSIITYRSSNINTIADLKKYAKTSNFLLAKPSSASGHIIPRLYLQTIGIESMENTFKSVNFTGGHQEVIDAVDAHKAELGAIATGYLANSIKNGEVNSKDIAVLWTSGPIVEGPIVANSSLSEAQKNKILALFFALPQHNPALWKKITDTYPGAKESGGYIRGKDEYYDTIRKLISHIDNLKLILQNYLKTKY
jgi:phosphonate transport system substrate-binding protein